MEEARRVIERGGHEHDVVSRAQRLLGKYLLREEDVVVGEQRHLGLARGAGCGENARDVVGADGWQVRKRLVARQDVAEALELGVRRSALVDQRDGLEGGDLREDGDSLLLVAVAVMEGGGADEGRRADLVHDIDEVRVAVVARQRVHHRADLEAGHVDDAELCPGGQLEGDDVSGLHALCNQPAGKATGLVVDLSIGVAGTLVIHNVLALRMCACLCVPGVPERLRGPVAFLVVELFLGLVNL